MYFNRLLVFILISIFIFTGCKKSADKAEVKPAEMNSVVDVSAMNVNDNNSDPDQIIKMTAEQYDFIPDNIKVKKGTKVRLEVTSTDVTHGIAIREYDINKALPVNKTVAIDFTADKVGSFDFHCSISCGPGHRDMKGTLIVE